MSKPVSICVIGSGYVGLVAAACFAEIGHRVVCVDNDEAKVKQLREGGVPIFEEHLPELLAKHRGSTREFYLGSGRGGGEERSGVYRRGHAAGRQRRAPICRMSRLWWRRLRAASPATK